MSPWPRRALGDVAELITKGTTPTSVGYEFTSDGVRFVKVESLVDGVVDHARCAAISEGANEALARSRLRTGDLLFSIAGTLGRVAIVRERDLPANTNQALAIIRLNGEVLPEYVALFLRGPAVADQVSSGARGVGLQNLNLAQVSALLLPVPPLDVQRRIVAKLDELLAQSRTAREQLEAVPALVEQYRQSVLAAAFRGDLTKEWRENNPDVEPASKLLERIRAERRRQWEAAELAKMKAKGKSPKDDRWKAKYEEPDPVDASELPELPARWCWAQLSALVPAEDGVVDGPFGSNLKSADYADEGPVVVRLGNLGLGVFKDGDLARVPEEKFNALRRHEVVAGDLVIAALADPVGRCCEVPASLGPAIVKADCVRARPVPPLSRRFVMWALNSPGALARAADAGHGLGRVRMNLTDIRARWVPVAPVEEQDAVTQLVEASLQGARALEEAIGSVDLSGLERSLLAKAFRGELDVTDAEVMRLQDAAADVVRGAGWQEGRGLRPHEGGRQTPEQV